MKIIDGTDTDKMQTVLAAGAELVERLRKLLKDYGLDDDDAVGVLLVASGGVLTSGEIDPTQYFRDLGISCSLWHRKEGIAGLAGALFFPHTNPELFKIGTGGN